MTRGLVLLLAFGACGPSEGAKGQCKDSLVVGDLVITEVFADFKAPVGGSGADEGKEWFEIYNATDRPIELEGLRVDHGRPDGSKLKSHVMAAVTIAPGQYFTLGNATPDLVPAYIDYGYSADLGDFFNTDGGRLALNCGDSEIDGSDYDTVKEGHSRQLTASTFPDYTLNDDLANFCEGVGAEFETGNFGTPGSENDCVPVIAGSCNDAGVSRAVVPPAPGQLVITEVMPQPTGTDGDREWFEVKALVDVDLNGLGLDRAGDTANPKVLASADCIHVAAGEYFLFTASTSTDQTVLGDLPLDRIKGQFNFALINGAVDAPGDVQLILDGTVIDAVSWAKSKADVSLSLDPGAEDAGENDQPGNFCDGSPSYGAGGSGTPGLVNGTCPIVVPAGSCDDAGLIRTIKKPALGEIVITEFMTNAAGADSTDAKAWFEVANLSAASFDLNDLTVSRTGATATIVTSTTCIPVAAGDFGLFARSNVAANNGGLDGVDALFNFTLVDSGVNRNLSILDGVTVLDTLAYTASASSADGKSIQLDPDNFTTTANDVFDPTAGIICQGTTAYGAEGNLGTPGAANVQCP